MTEDRRRHVNGVSHRETPLALPPMRTDAVVGEGSGSVSPHSRSSPLVRQTAPGGEGSAGRAKLGRFGKFPAAPEPGGQLRPLIGGAALSTQGSRLAGMSMEVRTRYLVDQYSYKRRVSPNGGLTLPQECCDPRITEILPCASVPWTPATTRTHSAVECNPRSPAAPAVCWIVRICVDGVILY